MRIGYASIFDPEDPLVWSGTEHRIMNGLRSLGHEIVIISKLSHGRSAARFFRKMCARASCKVHQHFWDLDTARDYALDLTSRIDSLGHVDCVVSTSLVPLAFLRPRLTAFVWTDASFVSLQQHHEEFSRSHLSKHSCRHAYTIDRLNVERGTKFVFSSSWAAKSLEDEFAYAVADVVPFGANYDVDTVVSKSTNTLVMTFLAVRWDEKGGPKAFTLFKKVREIFPEATFNVLGCRPPTEVETYPGVKTWGFVNKFTDSGKIAYERIMKSTDYVVVPTKAEAYGMFAAEAAAFGAIVLTHNIGGLSTIVDNESTGFTFDIYDGLDAWLGTIVRLQADPSLKLKIGCSARRRYETLLNWDSAFESFNKLIEKKST